MAIPGRQPRIPAAEFVAVSEGPLTVYLHQQGEIESANNTVIASKCEWSAQLIWLVEEGQYVEAGDVVARMDCTELVDRLRIWEIGLVNARKDYVRAQEDYRIQSLVNQSAQAQAELAEVLARLQLSGYQSAEYPQQVNDKENAVALAEQALAMARKQFDFTRSMVKLGYRQRSDLESRRVELMRATQAFSNATQQLNVLKEFTFDRQFKEYAGLYEQAKAELSRVDSVANSAMLSARSKIQETERVVAAFESLIEWVQKNIQACTLTAPKAGQIMYARYEGGYRLIDIGEKSFFQQEILDIIDRDQMQVQLRIHEARISDVQLNQPCRVVIDSYPSEPLQGVVTEISNIPTPARWPNHELREYHVIVALDLPDEQRRNWLAPGMTANVEILVGHRERTLSVPINCVVQAANRYVVFVRRGDDVEPREVELGIMNDKRSEILSGLNSGDEVVLKPRSQCSGQIDRVRQRFQTERDATSGELL